jgi:hypothetical protein
VPSDAAVEVVERLRAVAGSDESVTFWSGGTAEHPTYTWTFSGQELSHEQMASLSALELGIVLSEGDADGDGVPETLMLNFAHEGALPAPALITIAVPEEIGAAAALSPYRFSAQAAGYLKCPWEISAGEGLVSFSLSSCSELALSAVDLSAYSAAVLPLSSGAAAFLDTPTGQEQYLSAAQSATGIEAWGVSLGQSVSALLSPTLLIGLGALVLGALLAFGVLRHRRKAQVAAMQQGWAASTLAFEDIPSLEELIEVEEPCERCSNSVAGGESCAGAC